MCPIPKYQRPPLRVLGFRVDEVGRADPGMPKSTRQHGRPVATVESAAVADLHLTPIERLVDPQMLPASMKVTPFSHR